MACQPPMTASTNLDEFAPKLLSTAEGQIEDAVGNDAVTRDEGVRTVVAVRLERVVGVAAETGVSDIETRRLLIEEGIGHAKDETSGLALSLCLERCGKAVTNVAEAGNVIAESRNFEPRAIRRRVSAVPIVERIARCDSVARGCAEGIVVGRNHVEIVTDNLASLRALRCTRTAPDDCHGSSRSTVAFHC